MLSSLLLSPPVQEAEFIARLCEREIVSPPNLLSCFFKFIIYVCQVAWFWARLIFIVSG